MKRRKIIIEVFSVPEKGGGKSYVEEKRSMSKYELFLRSVMSGYADSINARFGTSDVRREALSAVNHAPLSPVYMEMGETYRVINLAEQAKRRLDKEYQKKMQRLLEKEQEKRYFAKFKQQASQQASQASQVSELPEKGAGDISP